MSALDLRHVQRCTCHASRPGRARVALVLPPGRFDFEVANASEAQAWCGAVTERCLSWRRQAERQVVAKDLDFEASEPERRTSAAHFAGFSTWFRSRNGASGGSRRLRGL